MRPNEQAAYDRGYEAGLAAAARKDNKPLTLDDIKGMSAEEVVARKDEVDAVMAGGES